MKKSIVVMMAILLTGSLIWVTKAISGSVTLTLERATLKNVDDAAGRWQHEGGKVLKGAAHVGHYAITRRVTFGGTDAQNTAMTTVTIFFLRERPPENLTLQGAHDFNSGKYIGSVSGASSKYAWAIGAIFSGKTDAKSLTIEWLGANQLTLP